MDTDFFSDSSGFSFCSKLVKIVEYWWALLPRYYRFFIKKAAPEINLIWLKNFKNFLKSY